MTKRTRGQRSNKMKIQGRSSIGHPIYGLGLLFLAIHGDKQITFFEKHPAPLFFETLTLAPSNPLALSSAMSHFGRSGPPDIRDTYSLLVLNISFRTTADDLFPLFDRYGKVVDVFIPRDRRTGDSRGFAFVRYKYADEAQKAVEKLDGRNVDGRNIMVQFAKYGPNAEPIHKGRIVEVLPKTRGRSRSRSPRPRHKDDHRDRDYRRRSRSRSKGRYDRYHDKEKDYRHRSKSRSLSPDYYRGRGRRSDDDRRRSRSRSYDSVSPDRRSYSPRRSPTPRRTPPSRGESPAKGSHGERSPSRSVSPQGRRAASRTPSLRSSD